MSTSFKIFFDENNIRRIRVESASPTYSEITSLLESLYPENYHPELSIKWQDEEGDKITVSSELEWNHLLQSVNERPIKLFVTEGKGLYFKDGPPAQPQYFYTENKEEVKEEPELLNRLQQSIPQCLQRLFKGNRILPYDIPDWLRPAVQIKRLQSIGNEVDLDVDIPKLFNVMHKRALELLSDVKNTAFIQQAKTLLQDMLELIPKHAVTLYNLSCAEALLGNTSEALKNLRAAIFDGGYSNVEHMEKDEDLATIRDTPEFKELVNSLKKEEPVIIEESQTMESIASPDIMQDWTNVDEELSPAIDISVPQVTDTPMKEEPILSLGEQKWLEAIENLKGMGFGQDQPYFGPQCAVLLEKYNGDLSAVINEFLQ